MKILILSTFAILAVSAIQAIELNVEEENHHLQEWMFDIDNIDIKDAFKGVVALVVIGLFLYYVVPALVAVVVPILIVSKLFSYVQIFHLKESLIFIGCSCIWPCHAFFQR